MVLFQRKISPASQIFQISPQNWHHHVYHTSPPTNNQTKKQTNKQVKFHHSRCCITEGKLFGDIIYSSADTVPVMCLSRRTYQMLILVSFSLTFLLHYVNWGAYDCWHTSNTAGLLTYTKKYCKHHSPGGDREEAVCSTAAIHVDS